MTDNSGDNNKRNFDSLGNHLHQQQFEARHSLAMPPLHGTEVNSGGNATAANSNEPSKADVLSSRGNKKPRDDKPDDDDNDNEAGGQAMVFPVKLHRMLTIIHNKMIGSPENKKKESAVTSIDEDTSIVSWQPHGRCFLVHKKDAFVENFLPKFFRQSKWASFQRQLNIYGFQRITAGRDRGAYYHELFVRGHPELASRIHRMKLKGIGQGRHRTNAELEPDFYSMKPIGTGKSVDSMADILAVRHQQHLRTSAAADLPAPAPALAGMTSTSSSSNMGGTPMNVLHFFGGNGDCGDNNPSSTGNVGFGANASTLGIDLSNLYFLTNGAGEYSQIMPPQFSQDAFQAVQQGSANCSSLMLANLFNNSGVNAGATSTNGNMATTGGANSQGRDQQEIDNSMSSCHQTNEGNMMNTNNFMQSMVEDKNSGSTQSQNGQQQQAQSALHQAIYSDSNQTVSNSNTELAELANSLGLDESSICRMSTAALTTLLSSRLSSARTDDPVGTGTRSNAMNQMHSPHVGNADTTNSNPLLFQGQQSNSSNNLFHLFENSSSSNDPAVQHSTRKSSTTAPVVNNSSFGQHYLFQTQGATPASQQLGFLNGGRGLQMSQTSSNPTFLDSIYEPISVKEDGVGPQQKVSGRNSPSGSVNSASKGLFQFTGEQQR